MAGFRELDRSLFPIRSIGSVVEIFRRQLERPGEPDLALLSIIVGAVENSLTCGRNSNSNAAGSSSSSSNVGGEALPGLELKEAESLYLKFHAVMKSSVDASLRSSAPAASRALVKRVSDVVWNSLTRSYYKDRPHLQSLYSYLTGSKLDCFGVAFAVVAGCQVLGFHDVHLALSEDHAWVVFGPGGTATAEVTWHGKGNEDKRGQAIGPGVSARSWLYVHNHPVICSRYTEVAALVSAINPSLNATNDASEVAMLQQQLLWLLYDQGHLAKYPMAIGNLGDLEEVSPTRARPPCSTLFREAILAARTYYNNQHVYPYTYQGGFFYRTKAYKEAFEAWADASDVIRKYNYSRDDEEIYKEFLEIANELIPHIIKMESSGHNAHSILREAPCFANLLRFYDGICQWEEGSATPILHIGWAKPLVNTISKFDADVRAQVVIICEQPEEDRSPDRGEETNGLNNNNYCVSKNGSAAAAAAAEQRQHHQDADLLRALESRMGQETRSSLQQANLHPSIVALTAACSEKILNPEYLLQGGGQPFVAGEEAEQRAAAGIAASTSKAVAEEENKQEAEVEVEAEKELVKGPIVRLRSHKMKGLKDLLLAEKLNTHAISLQLTAQSQVQVGKKWQAAEHQHQQHQHQHQQLHHQHHHPHQQHQQQRPKRSRRD